MGTLTGEQIVALVSLLLNTAQVLYLAKLKVQEAGLREHLDELHQENQQHRNRRHPDPLE